MKPLYFFYSLLIAAVMFSCSKDILEGETPGSISGTVSDRTTGEPVSTVKVSLEPGGKSTVTGSDGTFTFRNLESDSYTLTVTKEGYKQATGKVTVRPGDPTPAHLLIERIPAYVTADRDLLDFGSNASTNTLSFNIVNPGYVDLEWEIEERCDWITEVKPSKGTLKYGKTEAIVVVIDRSLLPAGFNEAVIVVRSSNGSSEVKVITSDGTTHLPALNMLSVMDITPSTATLNAEITDDGAPAYTERGFVYSNSPMPTVNNTIAKLTSSMTKDAKYSYQLKGLTLGEKYYVRAYAVNSVGTAYSTNEVDFIASPSLPVVNTLEITDADLSGGTATFWGTIVFAGDPAYTERGFVYSTMQEPTIYDNKFVASGEGVAGSFSKYVTSLPTTGYYMRAYATNMGGTVYGEEQHVQKKMWVEIPEASIIVQTEDLGIMNWGDAKSICESSRIGGFTDWRLPTKTELQMMYKYKDRIGFFKDSIDDYTSFYWSISDAGTYNYSYYSYYVNFYNGSTGSRSDSNNLNVRAVRTLNK